MSVWGRKHLRNHTKLFGLVCNSNRHNIAIESKPHGAKYAPSASLTLTRCGARHKSDGEGDAGKHGGVEKVDNLSSRYSTPNEKKASAPKKFHPGQK